ncbi:bifunctional diguanylate cyclase/phosphodiesterase [Frankia sp. CiP3]|uniref:putative bifunctional diguanylate cyclase/phosphodiesterase n=1 Tax=Frankia sp. CiP3 TaxID=2880971 RepID=UPI001EF70CE4|nr:bifunctional diguanylate cyclase/phosphodiesterase [Frankia sp. CiP3]
MSTKPPTGQRPTASPSDATQGSAALFPSRTLTTLRGAFSLTSLLVAVGGGILAAWDDRPRWDAFTLIPGAWVIVLAVTGMLAPRLVVRRGPRQTLLRSAIVTTGTILAILTAAVFMGSRSPLVMFPAPRAFAAAAVATALYTVSMWIQTAATARWSARAPTEYLRHVPWLGAAGMTAAFGLLVVTTTYWKAITLCAVPLAAAGLTIAYQFKLRSLAESNRWKEINFVSRELADGDEPAIVGIARRRAATLFQADDTALLLWPTPSAPLDAPSEMTDLPPAPESAPVASHEPAPPRYRPRAVRQVQEIAAPLMAGKLWIGVLTLSFRQPVAWHEREDQILVAFTHTVSHALAHTRLNAHARRQAQEQAHDANHDWLTGLGNRRLLMARTTAELERQSVTGGCVGLIMIDLDRFKIINDTLGHSAGDRVLQAIAERLRRGSRDSDVVTRLGGDEFAVLITGVESPAQVETVAAELADVLCRDVVLDDIPLAVEASLGVACCPDDGTTSEELLQHADIAMYQAKCSHPRWRRFTADSHDASLERLALVAELKSAISENELVLNYQPQIKLQTGQISGVEALVRWDHPERGMLSPERFVPAVEQSGLVQDFTRVILEQALIACAGWRASGFDITVSVNLSARNLLNTDLPGEVAKLLVKYSVPASSLTLEITETAMMADKTTAHRLLGGLREIGVRIAVDDFGTGFSSLTLLQERVLDEVKIDQTFVRKLLVEQGDAAIVAATIHLAHTHNLRVVAEGVETAELMEALTALHCDFAQGLHIGAAMPLAELTNRLREAASTPRLAVGTNARILPLHRRRP